jgi:hypothetical protein
MAKVKVNHNGACEGYAFSEGVPFDVQDSDVAKLQNALGNDLTVVSGRSKDTEQDDEQKPEVKPEEKDVQNAPVNKMVGNAPKKK